MKKQHRKVLPLVVFSTIACGLGTISEPQAVASEKEKPAEYKLPLKLAIEAASEAVRTCEANGHRVTVTIVDVAGYVKVQAKGVGSTIHTKDSSHGKAYTIATMGPVFDIDTTGAFAEMLNKAQANNPALAAIPNIPGILPLTGGVAIKAHGKIIAGIGVGGAPGGKKDEVCALAGVEKIRDRLPSN